MAKVTLADGATFELAATCPSREEAMWWAEHPQETLERVVSTERARANAAEARAARQAALLADCAAVLAAVWDAYATRDEAGKRYATDFLLVDVKRLRARLAGEGEAP